MVRHEDQPGPDRPGDVLRFGRDRPAGGRWRSRLLLACLVLVTALAVVLRTTDHQHSAGVRAAPRLPPVRVSFVGHRLLGVRAGWQLFIRGPDSLVRVQLGQGRITSTYVPSLDTASPAIAFVIGAHEAVIRPADLVAGYVVPDGGQARLLTGPLGAGGPLVPGPAGTQTAWVMAGQPTSPRLSLVTLSGRRRGQDITFGPGGPQIPSTAVSDGRGDVLLNSGNFTVYDAGPGWDHVVPGNVIAVGAANWLIMGCDPSYRHCRYQVADTAAGTRRTLTGATPAAPYYFTWPPTGVIAPDGATAAIAAEGRGHATTVHLVNLRTGAVKDLGVQLFLPGTNLSFGTSTSEDSMAWSPDSRWLFVATGAGRLAVINVRTGRIQSLGIRLPPVLQVAIRA
jgi:hypothetical protein